MRRFFAPPERFSDGSVTLSDDETRHLRDVLRMKPDETARIFDGEGREFLARIVSVGKRETVLEVIDEVQPAAPESDLDLTLAVTLFKNDKFDLVIQKAVELGVARIMPLVSFRSEVRLRDVAKKADRWQKIALEATKQCERARVMPIDEVRELGDLLADSAATGGLLVMFSEKDGGGIPENGNRKKITALVGPKGGWEDFEIESAKQRAFIPVKLGRRIMRAETAAITFAGILQHRFGDLG